MDSQMKVADLALMKIAEAKTLIEKTDDLEKRNVKGASKLQKRIKAEIKFLAKGLQIESDLKLDHVLCSNLGQLGAMLEVVTAVPNVTRILQPFSNSGYEKIVVDVVADSGKQWIKVIMRNPKALHLLYISGGRNGTRPLNEVAQDFLICAEQHPVFYCAPKVVFWFSSGVSEGLASALEGLGVQVTGQRIPDHQLGLPDLPLYGSDSEEENDDEEEDWDSSSIQNDGDMEDEECGVGDMNKHDGIGVEKACEKDNEGPDCGLERSEDAWKEGSRVKVCSENVCDEEREMEVQSENTCTEKKIELSTKKVDKVDGKLEIYCGESSDSGYNTSPSSPDSNCEEMKCQFPARTPLNDHILHSNCDTPKGTSQNYNSVEVSSGKEEVIRKVNLDVTAMIAYVSATANGGANFIFKENLLTVQAEWERLNPVKETLETYFKGCELMACQEAVDHFMTIIRNIGGPQELARARDLVARLTLVPGSDFLKDKVRLGGKVRELARVVFGTGHVHRAITVSSNGNFVRSAAQQGVNLAVLFHQARALTEIREFTANPL